MFKNNELLKQLREDLKEEKLVQGTVKTTSKKFGFLEVSPEESYFIPPTEMKKVLNGDLVEAYVEKENDKEFVKIEKLIETKTDVLLGEIIQIKNNFFLKPDNYRGDSIFFIKSNSDLKEGMIVKTKLNQHPIKNGKNNVSLIEIIGNKKEENLPWKYTLSKFDINTSKEYFFLSPNFEEELKIRKDLRDLIFYSIDSKSTKDIDDAIYIKKLKTGFNLKVAIADPTAFLEDNEENNELLSEKGFTHYFEKQAEKMLPEVISEDSASLKEGQDRLVICCDMIFDDNKKLVTKEVYLAVINSKAKLSYQFVEDLFENNIENDYSKEIIDSLYILNEFYKEHSEEEKEYEPEYKFIFEGYMPVGIEKREILRSQNVVALCISYANKTIAKWLKEHGKGIFNVNMGMDKAEEEIINDILKLENIDINVENLLLQNEEAIEEFKKLEYKIKDNEYIKGLIRKNLAKTNYSLSPELHIPVGDLYATFTSPIRKFSDFLNHRLIKSILLNQDYVIEEKYIEKINEMNKRSRQSVNFLNTWLYHLYFQDKKEETFNGKIVGINKGGLSIKLPDNGAFGFIPFSFIYSREELENITIEERYQIANLKEDSYKLNQELKVKIKDTEKDKLLFQLEE